MTGIVVTGPPRSGTSATARLLDLCGVRVTMAGDRVGGGPNNPTGHWESKTVLAINNRLLEGAGVRWWCPDGAIGPTDGSPLHDDAAAFRGVHPSSPWLCKDPRMAFTLAYWRRALGDDITAAIVVLRRPDEVVSSLRRTWRLSVEHAAALWVRYLHGAFSAAIDLPVAVVRFPEMTTDVAHWIASLAEQLAPYGIAVDDPPGAEVEAFLRPPKGNEVAVDDVPNWAWERWDAMVSLPTGVQFGVRPDGEEPPAVETILGPLRDQLRAGHPIDTRPITATTAESIG